ncbi:cupin domain-containing protein [Phormidesmis sp. 146-12]
MTSISQQSGSVVVNLLEKIDYSKSGVSRQVITKDAHLTSALVCITAGTTIPEHSASRTVCLTVLDGRGVLTLMGQEFVLEIGVFVKMLPDQPHSLTAIENLSFLHT